MRLLARLASVCRGLFRRKAAEGDLHDELSAYVGMLADEKTQAGVPAQEAQRQALLAAGGLEQLKERTRDARSGIFLDTLARDLRLGLRSLARTPGFTAATVIALALGIGASTAIFSVVEAVLLRPLPYRDPSRLVAVLEHVDEPVAPANFLDWRRQSTVYDRMGAAELWGANLTDGKVPESVAALRMTSDVMELLGVAPQLGRWILPQEETPGRDHSVVLSDRLWRRRFASDPGVLGRQIRLNGEPYTIVGIMPAGFEFPPFWARGVQLWAPLAFGDHAASRDGQSLRLFARLKPRVSLAKARAEIAAITANLERLYPGTNRDITVTPLQELVVGRVRPALLVLLAAVVFVLLIACANVAHMLLARSASRQKEVAVRHALGASRLRIARQFLSESVILGLLGGAFGLGLAAAGVRLLVALSPAGLPRVETIRLDVAVLAFTLAVSLLTGLAFGLAPALQAAGRDPARSLRDGERGSTEGPGGGWLRRLLIATEFALALVLLVGAGLMMRSFYALRQVDPGFRPDHVLSLIVSVAGSQESAVGRRAAFYQEILDRFRALPGVRSASAINHLPLAGDVWGWSFTVEGRPKAAPGENPTATYRVVLPGYFETMRLPLLRGRDVTASDRLDTAGVVIVNQWLADHIWPGEDPIGKRITFDNGAQKNPYWLTVVGVASNALRSEWTEEPSSEVYLPYLQNREYLERPSTSHSYLTLVLRAKGDPAQLAPAAVAAVRSLDRSVTVSQVQTMGQVVDEMTAEPRFYLLLLGVFAALALALAAVGVYGVMSYVVSRRTHEIGIRIALGAGRAQVERLVIGQGMGTALAGGAAGMVAALLLTRLMGRLLYGVGATDPATFALVAVVLAAVALLASWIPARRATRIHPLEAIRHD